MTKNEVCESLACSARTVSTVQSESRRMESAFLLVEENGRRQRPCRRSGSTAARKEEVPMKQGCLWRTEEVRDGKPHELTLGWPIQSLRRPLANWSCLARSTCGTMPAVRNLCTFIRRGGTGLEVASTLEANLCFMKAKIGFRESLRLRVPGRPWARCRFDPSEMSLVL